MYSVRSDGRKELNEEREREKERESRERAERERETEKQSCALETPHFYFSIHIQHSFFFATPPFNPPLHSYPSVLARPSGVAANTVLFPPVLHASYLLTPRRLPIRRNFAPSPPLPPRLVVYLTTIDTIQATFDGINLAIYIPLSSIVPYSARRT